MKKIITILGPTAVGKSNLAVEVAKSIEGEIISADSRQVFKGLNIGSGKITQKEMHGIPHHLLNVVELEEYFSVGDFIELADTSIRKIQSHNKVPIITGGSGFYLYSLLYTTIANVPPNSKLRDKYKGETAEELYSILKTKDEEYSLMIDRNNKRRLIRALEIIDEIGKMPLKNNTKRFESINIGINVEREELDQKIKIRLQNRWDGIIDEINLLIKKDISTEWLKGLGLEYKYITQFILGELEEEEAKEKLYIATRRFSKKQENWWKRIENIKWFSPCDSNEICKYLEQRYEQGR